VLVVVRAVHVEQEQPVPLLTEELGRRARRGVRLGVRPVTVGRRLLERLDQFGFGLLGLLDPVERLRHRLAKCQGAEEVLTVDDVREELAKRAHLGSWLEREERLGHLLERASDEGVRNHPDRLGGGDGGAGIGGALLLLSERGGGGGEKDQDRTAHADSWGGRGEKRMSALAIQLRVLCCESIPESRVQNQKWRVSDTHRLLLNLVSLLLRCSQQSTRSLTEVSALSGVKLH
jgi:hypothetical protein